jgi:hypothetical protein
MVTEGVITRTTLLWELGHPSGLPVAEPAISGALSPPSPELVPHPVDVQTPVRQGTPRV